MLKPKFFDEDLEYTKKISNRRKTWELKINTAIYLSES